MMRYLLLCLLFGLLSGCTDRSEPTLSVSLTPPAGQASPIANPPPTTLTAPPVNPPSPTGLPEKPGAEMTPTGTATMPPTRTATLLPTQTPSATPTPLPLPKSGDWELSLRGLPDLQQVYAHQVAPVGNIWTMEWSPNGKLLAVSGESGVALFDGETLKLLRVLDSRTQCTSLSFNADGSRLSGAGYSAVAQVWDVANARVMLTLPDAGFMVALSPDGKKLAAVNDLFDVGPDGTPLPVKTVIQVYQVDSGKLLLSLEAYTPLSDWNMEPVETIGMFFSANGSLIHAVDNFGDVRAWSLTGGGLIGALANPATRSRLSSGFCKTDGSTGGATFALVCYINYAPCSENDRGCQPAAKLRYDLSLWDTHQFNRSRFVTIEDAPGEMRSVVYEPGLNNLGLLNYSGKLEVRSVSNGKPTGQEWLNELTTAWAGTLKNCWQCAPPALALKPGSQGNVLAAGYLGKIEVWDLAGKKLLNSFENPIRLLTSAALGVKDGRPILATGFSDGGLTWLSLPDGATLNSINQAHTKKVTSLSFTSGDMLVSAGADAKLSGWSGREEKPQVSYTIRQVSDARGVTYGFAVNPATNLLAINALKKDGKPGLILRDLLTGKDLFPLTAESRQAAFSRDGQWLAQGSEALAIWNTQTGEKLKAFTSPEASGQVNGLALSPDGSMLASAQDQAFRLWSVKNNRVLAQIEIDATAARVSFSPSGCLVALGDTLGQVRILDVKTGAVSAQWWAHAGRVEELAFSEDGRLLLSMGKDGSARVWGQAGVLNLPAGEAAKQKCGG